MVDQIAKRRRKLDPKLNIWGPSEMIPFRQRFSAKQIFYTWMRPFKMFFTEPIVLALSLLSGFSDALIFMFSQSFNLVYAQWGFDTTQQGFAFIPIGIGYLLAYLLFIPSIRRNTAMRLKHPSSERAQYESKLWWLLWTAPYLPIGLIGFAWTSGGSIVSLKHGWIASMFFAIIVGIANYSIYMSTVDYMICAYGQYSASATGRNAWSRDFLAGVLTLPATPFFTNIGGKRHLQIASTILFVISLILVMAVYIVYWKGPSLRRRSPFAQHLAANRLANKVSGSMGAELTFYIKTPMGRRKCTQLKIDQDATKLEEQIAKLEHDLEGTVSIKQEKYCIYPRKLDTDKPGPSKNKRPGDGLEKA